MHCEVQADKLEAKEHNQWKARVCWVNKSVNDLLVQEKREARIAVMEEQPQTQTETTAKAAVEGSFQAVAAGSFTSNSWRWVACSSG